MQIELPLNFKDIIKLLPHRYPFLLVDRIIEIELYKTIVGIKNVTANEPFFVGHFPDNPIMPGVLIVEGMAQTGGVLARLSLHKSLEKEGPDQIFFMSIDKVKFRKPVLPGDQIRFEVEAIRTGTKVWKMSGKALVEGKLVTEAILVASIG